MLPNNPKPRGAVVRDRLIASTYNRLMNRPIYLDHSATTPMAPQAVDAMAEAMRVGYANPASQHDAGRRARRVVEQARERILSLLGGESAGRSPDRLIFTSGGTEANNLAILGLAAEQASEPGELVVSPIEHPSVAAAVDQLVSRGWEVRHLPVSTNGVVDADALELLLSPRSRLVSVMLGNNETGAIQPVATLAAVAHEHEIPIHTDAVQAVTKIDVHFHELGATTMSFAAHKFHGPTGIGGLIVRGNTQLRPQLFGGFQQAGMRPGTESVPLVVGMREALELYANDRDARRLHLASLRDRFERQICTALPFARVVADDAERLPHTANIAFVGLDRQALFLALDMAGIACSTGSACASGSSEPSPVLLAMGVDEGVIRGSIRFGLGAATSAADVDEATRRIVLICNKLRGEKGP